MLRFLIFMLVSLPFALAFLFFAWQNSHPVDLFLLKDQLALPWPLPLFVVLFLSFFLGFLFGGFSAWAGAGEKRKEIRKLKKEKTALGLQIKKQEQKLTTLRTTKATAALEDQSEPKILLSNKK